MNVRLTQIMWGGSDKRYLVRLYEMKDGEKVWYRINIDDDSTAKFAKMEFDGKGAREMAQREFDDVVIGDKTPLDWAWQ